MVMPRTGTKAWRGKTRMIALLQRVTDANVTVAGQRIAAIGPGMLALVAVERGDGGTEVERMAARLLAFRMFSDAGGRMNLNIAAAGGQILLVPQFTLAADTDSGHRPSFSGAAAPEEARRRFDELVIALEKAGQTVATGQFGADMRVALCNDGPVTFRLRVAPG
jgi:D-tyrosyl-tRNA(Tyr) deacylase